MMFLPCGLNRSARCGRKDVRRDTSLHRSHGCHRCRSWCARRARERSFKRPMKTVPWCARRRQPSRKVSTSLPRARVLLRGGAEGRVPCANVSPFVLRSRLGSRWQLGLADSARGLPLRSEGSPAVHAEARRPHRASWRSTKERPPRGRTRSIRTSHHRCRARKTGACIHSQKARPRSRRTRSASFSPRPTGIPTIIRQCPPSWRTALDHPCMRAATAIYPMVLDGRRTRRSRVFPSPISSSSSGTSRAARARRPCRVASLRCS